MQTFQITSPNTCALVVVGSIIDYVEAPPTAEIFAPDTATFTEYLTPTDALTAALVIDPTYDGSLILGLLPVTVDTQTGSGEYTFGDTATLECVVSSTVPSTVAYQWYDSYGAIAGETSTTLTLTNVTNSTAGAYNCYTTVTATDGSNRTSSQLVGYKITASPATGNFTLTRSGNNITTGLFNFLRGFTDTSATIEVPSSSLTISYDPVDGFKTTGSPLLAVDQAAELFINGAFVKSLTIHPVDGTFNYNFVI